MIKLTEVLVALLGLIASLAMAFCYPIFLGVYVTPESFGLLPYFQIGGFLFFSGAAIFFSRMATKSC